MLVSLVGCGKKDDNKSKFDIGNKSNVQISKNAVILSIKKETLTEKGATFKLKNNDTIDYEYNDIYEIEIKQNGDWHKINVEIDFIQMSYELKVGETKKFNLNWENTYGKLSSGQYRIIKEVYANNKQNNKYYISTEFVIK